MMSVVSAGRRGASRSRTQAAWRALHASGRGHRHAPPIAALVMPTLFKAQNGLEIHQNTPITVTGCPKAKKVAKKKAKKAAKASHPNAGHVGGK